MYVLVCYDIRSDRRRRKLRENLKAYLTHVQKSVFEGDIPAPIRAKVRNVVRRTIDMEIDTVRIYQLCRGCRPLTEHIGRTVHVPDEAEDVIV